MSQQLARLQPSEAALAIDANSKLLPTVEQSTGGLHLLVHAHTNCMFLLLPSAGANGSQQCQQ